MRKLALVVLLSAMVPFVADARSRSEPIRNPVTINLETKASPAQVKKAIKLAVLSRKWDISNEKSGSFDASYTKPERRGDLMVKINVAYTGKSVTIKYVDSQNMGYDGGSIHRYYNAWVGNLEKDIPIYVEREYVSSQ